MTAPLFHCVRNYLCKLLELFKTWAFTSIQDTLSASYNIFGSLEHGT